jgi:protein prenyltransferase alpha subunit repeat containing protein 1
MTKWTKVNVSDYCGFHHRQFLLLQLEKILQHTNSSNMDIKTSNMCKLCNFWQEECDYVNSLIQLYPGHETLWCHKRALVYHLVVVVAPKHHNKFVDGEDKDVFCVEKEIKFADACMADEEAIYLKEQRYFAAAFKLWILEV